MAWLVIFSLFAAVVGSWIDDPVLQRKALAKRPMAPRFFTLDLDLPPKDRWVQIYSDPLFKSAAADLQGYFAANVPKWALPMLESIAGDVRGHFHDYGEEMLGIAKTMQVSVGTIVLVNLVYSLEGIAGYNCSLRNTTGPCNSQLDGPGLCTSLVAEASDGTMWHGRNLDWNLPNRLRRYVFDVDFVRGSKHIFRATTMAGLVGALHGLRSKSFSVSINARDRGGNVLVNILKFLTEMKAISVTHLLRKALDAQHDFDTALQALAHTPTVEPAYFILGGAGTGQGAVISRERNPPARDVWLLNKTSAPAPWFVLQTNYDHWESPPAWDDRRTPSNAHMLQLGRAAVGEDGLYTVLRQWPTFNNHTDITGVMGINGGSYLSLVWMEDDADASAHSGTVSSVPSVVVV